ncbi:hypothetical protein EMIT048CA2_50034 [Pseudomonas chlororaphis]
MRKGALKSFLPYRPLATLVVSQKNNYPIFVPARRHPAPGRTHRHAWRHPRLACPGHATLV